MNMINNKEKMLAALEFGMCQSGSERTSFWESTAKRVKRVTHVGHASYMPSLRVTKGTKGTTGSGCKRL